MKKSFALFLSLLFLLLSGISVAQNNILAGKITDKNNQPVAGAVVKIYNEYSDVVTTTDANGLYYAGKVLPGNYRIVILTNNKKHIAKRVNVPSAGLKGHFYNFSLKNKNAIALVTTEDPFVAAKFSEIEKQDYHTIIEYN